MTLSEKALQWGRGGCYHDLQEIVAVNLANQHGSEGVLSAAFKEGAERYAGKAGGFKLVAFDFHKQCGATRYDRSVPGFLLLPLICLHAFSLSAGDECAFNPYCDCCDCCSVIGLHLYPFCCLPGSFKYEQSHGIWCSSLEYWSIPAAPSLSLMQSCEGC